MSGILEVATVADGRRQELRDLDLGLGKHIRLHRLLHACGPGNGSLLLLAADQGLEGGPAEFADYPEGADPRAQVRLAQDGGFSAIVCGIGLAERYLRAAAGRVGLVLKLNGKTNLPPDDEALAPLNASVEDAVRLGADAVGYTLYVGSPAQFEDFTQLSQVRQECQRMGMPLIVRAVPRGAAVERKGGGEGLYALEYAARVADELGADLVALAAPIINPQRDVQAPKPYNTLQITQEEALRRVVTAASSTPVLLRDTGAASDEDLLRQARAALQAGAIGLVLGPSLLRRPPQQAVDLAGRAREALSEPGL